MPAEQGRCCAYFLLTTAVTTIICAFVMPSVLHNVIKKAIHDQVVVTSKDSPGYDAWLTGGGVPLHFAYNFHTVQNAEAVVAKGDTYKINTVGPYVYKQVSEKVEVNFSSVGGVEGAQVEFKNVVSWQPVPELSVGDPTKDKVTIINPAYDKVLNTPSTIKTIFPTSGYPSLVFAICQLSPDGVPTPINPLAYGAYPPFDAWRLPTTNKTFVETFGFHPCDPDYRW